MPFSQPLPSVPPEPIAMAAWIDVEALAERIGGRVEQRQMRSLLIVVHQRPVHFRLADPVLKRGNAATDDPAASTGTISLKPGPRSR